MVSRIKFDQINIRTILSKFSRANDGNIAAIFVILSSPVFLSVGIALDYGYAQKTQTELQSATDSAALAGAAGTHLKADERIQIANKIFMANFRADARHSQPTPVTTIDADGKVTVNANTNVTTIFLKLVKIMDLPVSSSAVAKSVNPQPICVLALNTTMDKAINIGGTGTFIAKDCAILSNSTSDAAIYASGTSTAEASAFCAPGGYDGFNFTPTPTTCQPVADPYKDMVLPTVGLCKFHNTSIKKQDGPVVLTPGVYCGGINIQTQAEVTMGPGVYIIKNGDFSISSQAQATGSQVTFFMTGTNTSVEIDGGATVSLSAATAGAYKDFLFMQDPLSNPGNINKINGGGTVELVGTFYFPTQGVRINGNGTFSINSALMPIIADHVIVLGNGVSEIDLDEDQMAANLPKLNQGTILVK